MVLYCVVIMPTTNCIYSLCGGARQLLSNNTWILGGIQTKILPQTVAEQASSFYGSSITKVSSFLRLRRNGEVFYSKMYTRVKIRNSFTIAYNADSDQCSYGQIMYFILVYNKPAAVISILRPLPILPSFNPCEFIVPVETTHSVVVIDVCAILCKCVFVEVSSSSYVVKFPSSVNLD